MTIEPMDPNSAPIGGPGQPVLRDGAIPPPYPQGLAPQVIAPLEKAGPGWRAVPAPAHPGDWQRPGFSGVIRL